MELFTLYVGQGALAAIRAGGEAIIVDSHMPNTDDVCQEQIERSLEQFLLNQTVRGLILTGLDKDHACTAGVESILASYEPGWVMYPKYYKETDTASEVFEVINRHVRRRELTWNPLLRKSVRVDRVESRFLTGLAHSFTFELFSPHIDDIDCSNSASIVLKLTGLDSTGFSYLITGDTEAPRWDSINSYFHKDLSSPVMAAPHHGARGAVNAQTLLHVNPHTVLISAGISNSYGHPDGVAVKAYRKVAKQVFSTNGGSEGVCFFTRKAGGDFVTTDVRHFAKCAASG